MAHALRSLQRGVSQLLANPNTLFSLTTVRAMSDGKLFVGGLSFYTTEDGLRTAFAAHGEIMEVRVVNDRETGKSRGFGFVTYANEESAATAMNKLNGQMLDGRPLRVSRASDRPGPGPRPGGFAAAGGYGTSGVTSGGEYSTGGGAGGGGDAASNPTPSVPASTPGSAPSIGTRSTSSPSKPVNEPLFLSDPPGSASSSYSPLPPRPRNKYNRGGSYGRSSSSYASGLYDDLASEYGGGSSSRNTAPAVRVKKVHELVVDDDSDGEGNFGFCR